MPALETVKPVVRIIEDDPSVQMFLSGLVELAGFVTTNYGSAEQFMSDDNLAQPGCVLIDLMLPGLNGADLVHWIGQQVHPLPVIIVSGCGSVPAAVLCFKRGIVDFIEKPIDSELLLAAVRRAVALDIEQELANQRVLESRQLYATLTNREKEVLTSMSQGLLSKQIARNLSLSTRTVEKHRTNIMKKMQTDSLAKLLRTLVELGL